jgi:predicted nucleic acid-binding protein
MEEVVFDTNALIDLFRNGKKTVKGFTTVFNVIEFPKAVEFKELAVIYPVVEDYLEAMRISTALVEVGKPIPAVDVLVSAMCIRRDLALRTFDKHFVEVRSVRKEFKLRVVEQ